MNILIYTQWSTYLNYPVGGAETSLRILAEKLTENGHRVLYLTEEKGGRWFRHRSEVVDGVEVHIVNLPNMPTLGIGWLLKIRRYLIERAFSEVAEKLIQDNDIQLVHTYHEVPGMLRFLKLKESKKLNFSTVLRNGGKFWVNDLKENPDQYQSYHTVFNQVDSINFNTMGMGELFEEACSKINMNVNLNHSLIHDIGLDLDKIIHRWALPKSGPFKMIMASRFSSHQKRQDLLVDAVSKLPKDMNIELTLIGNGPEKKAIEKRIKNLKLENQIRVGLFLKQDELWERMTCSHLYVHACDFEGLSKIIIEAMAMGLPVLTSDVLPLNDYIKDGKNGFLVENIPESWAERLKELYHNQQQLTEISPNARQFIVTHYSADSNVNKYIRYFEEVIQMNQEALTKSRN